MGDEAQPRVQDPSQRAGTGSKHSQNHTWNGMDKGNSHPGGKNARKAGRKSGQAGGQGEATRAGGSGDLVENKRGEMERAEGSVIAGKQAEPATAGGERRKIST